MKDLLKLGCAGVGLALSVAACDPEPSHDDAGDNRDPDAYTQTADAFVPDDVDADLPPVDAGSPNDTGAPLDVGPGPITPDAGPLGCETGYPALSLVDVAPGYDWTRPVFLTSPAGSSDLYVVDARGYIYIVRDGAVLATPFLDMRTTIGTLSSSGDERGLLGLAFHPDYATNGRFFIAYTPVGGDNIVAEGRRSASADVAETARTTLLEIDDFANNHNGGMVAFGPDGFLYIGTGDGGGSGDPRRTSQDPASLLGKMLRIDVSGTSGTTPYRIPAGNPFVGDDGVRDEIWAFGYRNPWRFSFDRTTDEMYVADVGQGLWEEIDVEPAGEGGRNYGWSRFEGTHNYTGGSALRAGDTHTPPVYELAHDSSSEVLRNACSITGGYVYRGAAIAALRGAYLFGDYCSSDVAAFRYCDGEAREPTRLDVGGGVSGAVSFGEDSAGELYVLNLGGGGQVRRIVAR